MPSIWYRREGCKPEKIDNCDNRPGVIQYIMHEYRLAFALYPGQDRYGKDKLWFGRKKDEPKE